MRVTSFLAMSVFLAASGAITQASYTSAASVVSPRGFETARLHIATTDVASRAETRAFRGVVVWNRNTNARETIALYKDDGTLDEASLATFIRVAGSAHDAVAGRLATR